MRWIRHETDCLWQLLRAERSQRSSPVVDAAVEPQEGGRIPRLRCTLRCKGILHLHTTEQDLTDFVFVMGHEVLRPHLLAPALLPEEDLL